MPTEIIDPASTGADDGWTLIAGGSKAAATTRPDDGDTTCIESASANHNQLLLMAAMTSSAETIDQVDMLIRIRRTAGSVGGVRHRVRNGGTSANCGTTHSPSTSYTNYTQTSVSRPNGGSWVPSDFDGSADAIQCGVATLGQGASDGHRCTTIYADITYTPPSGGYTWLLASWLPPLIQVASHGLLAREISQALNMLRVRPSSEEDFARILEGLRKRPVFCYS